MKDRFRILVVGTGSIGHRHVRCFLRTGQAEVAICEPRDELRHALAATYDLGRHFSSLDDALPYSWDGAVIATPAHLHVEQACRLAEAGCHLLIEKPLSLSESRISELARIAAEKSLVVSVAYVLRAHPALAAVKQALDAGRFGDPVELVAVSGQHFPTYRPAYREIYYRRRATGGGAVQDALTHLINAGELLIGPVVRVVADLERQVLEGVDVEDTVHVLARHHECLASYSLNQHQAPNETTVTVVCRQGTVRFEGHRWGWRWMTEPGGSWHEQRWTKWRRDDLFVMQARRFLASIRGGQPPLCTLDEGWQTLRAQLAILQSAQTGQWCSVDAYDSTRS